MGFENFDDIFLALYVSTPDSFCLLQANMAPCSPQALLLWKAAGRPRLWLLGELQQPPLRRLLAGEDPYLSALPQHAPAACLRHACWAAAWRPSCRHEQHTAAGPAGGGWPQGRCTAPTINLSVGALCGKLSDNMGWVLLRKWRGTWGRYAPLLLAQ